MSRSCFGFSKANGWQFINFDKKEILHSDFYCFFLFLVYDSNTLYMEECEMSEFKSEGIWMTESYACGSVFTDSVLDFLASAVSTFNSKNLSNLDFN